MNERENHSWSPPLANRVDGDVSNDTVTPETIGSSSPGKSR